ncbi:MAG: hypothetical protein RL112_1126 [Planctomycetota bacterium]
MNGPDGLPPRLELHRARIERMARERGLSFCETRFVMLDASEVNAVAAYGGFPVRYPSWRFGMEWERLEKGRQWGLSKIYELVVNNDPAWAYLVRSNSEMEQKLVMAHVYGHVDFFTNNLWFEATDRSMVDTMAAHAADVRRLIDERGHDEVESFLDACLSLDNLVDPWGPLRERLKGSRRAPGPAADLEAVLRRGRGEERRAPTCDVLGFLCDHAPLADWQRALLRIVRAESAYFLPQRLTKVMNEGWASYWHAKILVEGGLSHAEIVDFADCHSGATAAAPGRLNPYKLGIELFRVVEERGLDLFRLRRAHHDVTLIDELVDEDFAARVELFAPSPGPDGKQRSWREKKEELLRALSNGASPRIELVEDDHLRRGELLLAHHHDGRDLEAASARAVLENLARLWGRPVHLDTVARGSAARLTARPESAREAG